MTLYTTTRIHYKVIQLEHITGMTISHCSCTVAQL